MQRHRVGWIKDIKETKVTEHWLIPFFIGKYKDKVICSVVDMNACHMLLRRHWKFDLNLVHHGKDDSCSSTKTLWRLSLLQRSQKSRGTYLLLPKEAAKTEQVKSLLLEFQDILPKELLNTLLPTRNIQH